jgi:uncharacterized peroxidase-related enzyme
MSSTYQLTLSPKTLESAEPKAKSVLAKAQSQVGFIPNMYAVMANSPALLETYLDGYARFRAESGFTTAEQEVVFLTISRENRCHYCMAAHSTLADTQSNVPVEVTNAIRDGCAILDAKLAALSVFTRVMVDKRGLPTQEEVEAFLDAGYTERHILDIVLAIAVKTLSNYSNHLFDTPVDEVFSGRVWAQGLKENDAP